MMKIVTIPTASLREKCKEVDWSLNLPILDMVDVMETAMKEAKGVGLAASQIGIQLQLFIIDPQLIGVTLPRIYVNPSITHEGIKKSGYEGCLSIPGRQFSVRRYETVNVSAWDAKGRPFNVSCSGFVARVISHEFDHCLGRLIDATGTEIA
jgi:peptide deformylase